MAASGGTRRGNGAGKGSGHGPAKGQEWGDGWGGPASGRYLQIEGNRAEFEPGNLHGMTRNGKAAQRAMRTEMMETKLFEIGMDGENEATQVAALARLHAIYNGQPVAKTVSANVDDVSNLSDDAIRAELARLSGDEAEASDGAENTSLTR